MTKCKVSRDRLMRQIQEASFAMYDAQLYLDSHPKDEAGMARFNEYNSLRRGLTEEYTSMFGPITTDIYTADGMFTWATEPWPWQEG